MNRRISNNEPQNAEGYHKSELIKSKVSTSTFNIPCSIFDIRADLDSKMTRRENKTNP